MDRLVCGDVGYGKTELAIRAAFRAASSGYQVAVLVPTTVLAYQHYRTFASRMEEFPVRIEMLSRFRTKAQQQRTLAGVAEGTVEIVIGTHRILSGDVSFKNLGLIVVDEEQRFGVKAKEHLKALRASVDVLTLTATPIPRTLNMALLGLRDISSLETPPLDRLAVRSQVTYFDEGLVKQAILRELRRDGQVFYIHNRVADLSAQVARIEKLVPEAAVGMAHGQMKERELEKVMLKFVDGDINVLVCTTIVESGLDIRNANTLFVNNAHMYGLADLHQLRGRVGRYNRRAYAYFLIPGEKILPEVAMKRLKAIEDFHELGAGFQIAMRDLEIRGAGNIVGFEQSGHINAVGYDMYCRLLRDAVETLKGEPASQLPDVHVDLGIRAFIPDDYIARAREKVDIYRRLGQARSPDDLAALESEMTDRFGPPPPPVSLMLEQARLRLVAGRLGITGMQQVGDKIRVNFIDAARLEPVLKPAGRLVRVTDTQTFYIVPPEDLDEAAERVEFLRNLLQGAVTAD
jgi:transcription-repair coupling factor (superfamily II helicase)